MINKLLYIFLFISLSITTAKAQVVSAERIYTQVENMPRMCECAAAKDNMYKLDKCTVTTLSQWMIENMNYPQAALDKGTQGTCRVRVVIDLSLIHI